MTTEKTTRAAGANAARQQRQPRTVTLTVMEPPSGDHITDFEQIDGLLERARAVLYKRLEAVGEMRNFKLSWGCDV